MRKDIEDKAEIHVKDIFNRPARNVVTLDLEKYKHLLNDPALSEVQKEEFLQALWSIVVAFVELGFGVHPLQEVYEQQQEHDLGELKQDFGRKTGKDAADRLDRE